MTKFLNRCRRAKMKRLLKETLRRSLEGRKSVIVNLSDKSPGMQEYAGDLCIYVYGFANQKFVSPTATRLWTGNPSECDSVWVRRCRADLTIIKRESVKPHLGRVNTNAEFDDIVIMWRSVKSSIAALMLRYLANAAT